MYVRSETQSPWPTRLLPVTKLQKLKSSRGCLGDHRIGTKEINSIVQIFLKIKSFDIPVGPSSFFHMLFNQLCVCVFVCVCVCVYSLRL